MHTLALWENKRHQWCLEFPSREVCVDQLSYYNPRSIAAVVNPIIPPAIASTGVCPIDSFSVFPSCGVSIFNARAWSPAWNLTFIASYMMMIEKTRHIRNISLQGPYLIPIEVASAITKVEWADGIPPEPSIFEKLNLHFAACTTPFTTIATRSAINGIRSVYEYRYVWNCSNINRECYRDSTMVYSFCHAGETTVIVSPTFLPTIALPIGDSLLILPSRILASWEPTIT